MEKSKGIGILLVVFVITTLALGGYLLYDKVLKEPEKVEAGKGESNDSTVNTVSVVDGANLLDPYYSMFNIKAPKINGSIKTTTNMEKLNYTMANDTIRSAILLILEAESNGNYRERYSKGSNIIYDYIIKDDIMIINIMIDWFVDYVHQSGPWEKVFSAYYYDIKNDEILSISEASRKLNLSLDNVHIWDSSIISECKLVSSYDELEKALDAVIFIENNKISLINNFPTC